MTAKSVRQKIDLPHEPQAGARLRVRATGAF